MLLQTKWMTICRFHNNVLHKTNRLTFFKLALFCQSKNSVDLHKHDTAVVKLLSHTLVYQAAAKPGDDLNLLCYTFADLKSQGVSYLVNASKSYEFLFCLKYLIILLNDSSNSSTVSITYCPNLHQIVHITSTVYFTFLLCTVSVFHCQFNGHFSTAGLSLCLYTF